MPASGRPLSKPLSNTVSCLRSGFQKLASVRGKSSKLAVASPSRSDSPVFPSRSQTINGLQHLFVRCERLQFDAQTDQQANHQFNVANQRAARAPDSRQLTRSPGAGFGQDTSRLDDASKRMAGSACGGPQAFRLLRRDIHRETAGNGAAFVMYLEHDPHR